MKASAFLKLVGEARKEAKAYYAAKRDHPIEARSHLIEAKRLEKLIDQVVAEGTLEPDEPTVDATLEADLMTEEQIGMFDEPDAGDLLDTSV